MTTSQQRPSRHQQRRIRIRHLSTGDPYMIVAKTIKTEQEMGRRYLRDPAVPALLAAALRRDRLIPLEPLNQTSREFWLFRCSRCDTKVDVRIDKFDRISPNHVPSFMSYFDDEPENAYVDYSYFERYMLHYHHREVCTSQITSALGKLRREADEL